LSRGASFAVACCVAAAVTAAAADRKGDTAPSEATLHLYRSKCQPCHMADGNSPLEPMNFADGKWAHGSKPEEVAKVINEGVPTTAMPFKAQLTRTRSRRSPPWPGSDTSSLAWAGAGP
jgi:mono/diheme cytochrome c family protein